MTIEVSALNHGAGTLTRNVPPAGVSAKLVERLTVTAALGLAWFSTLTMDSTYAPHILPALFLTYFGLGWGSSA